MVNLMENFKIDSIVGNCIDSEGVINKLKQISGLKPFLQFELEFDNGVFPMTLIMVGETTLELVGKAKGKRPSGLGYISNVVLELPDVTPGKFQLEQDLNIEIRKGPKKRIIELEIYSSQIEKDLDILVKYCGFEKNANTRGDDVYLTQSNMNFCIRELEIKDKRLNPEDIHRNDTDMTMLGWHRLALSCKNLERAVAQLKESGSSIIIPPYKVMPGLNEATFCLPSGLVVQPVKQQLWKMLPTIAAKGIASKLKGKPIRFRT